MLHSNVNRATTICDTFENFVATGERREGRGSQEKGREREEGRGLMYPPPLPIRAKFGMNIP